MVKEGIEFKNKKVAALHSAVADLRGDMQEKYQGKFKWNAMNVAFKQIMLSAAEAFPEDRLAVFTSIGADAGLRGQASGGAILSRPKISGVIAESDCKDCPGGAVSSSNIVQKAVPVRVSIPGVPVEENEGPDEIEVPVVIPSEIVKQGEDGREQIVIGDEEDPLALLAKDLEAEGEIEVKQVTPEQVIEQFDNDIEMMKRYCDKFEIKYHHASKQPKLAKLIAAYQNKG